MKVKDLKKVILEVFLENQKKDNIPGGLAKNKTLKDFVDKYKVSLHVVEKELEKGIQVEMEHTTSRSIAKEIAMDHLWEDLKYYTKLKTVEKK